MSSVAKDFIDLLRALSDHEVRFMVVGAYALGQHGRPRATGDLDVWVEPSEGNAPRVFRALAEFGAPLADLSVAELATPGMVFQMGVEPFRIDILTAISGVEFAEAWPRRMASNLGGQRVDVLGLEDLIRNKRASGRPKDLLDVVVLERLKSLKATSKS
jgi:hypothetical protein